MYDGKSQSQVWLGRRHSGKGSILSSAAMVLLFATRAHAEPAQMRERAERGRLTQTTGDGKLSVSVGGFVQARYAAGDGGAPFSLPRTRLYTFGHLLDPDVRYRLMLGTAASDPAIRLFDAYGEWGGDAIRVRAGYFKIPVIREWMESARLLGSVERAAATIAMLPGRGTGLMLSGDPSRFVSYAIGAFDGPRGFQEVGPTAATRGVWNVLGRPIEGEIDFENSALRVSLGTSVLARLRDEPTSTYRGEVLHGVDIAVRARGFDVSVEGMVRRRYGVLRAHTDLGGVARVDRYINPLRVSVGARVSVLRIDSEERRREESEVELDVGFYPYGHQLKLLGDVGVRAENGTEWSPVLRVQAQAAF